MATVERRKPKPTATLTPNLKLFPVEETAVPGAGGPCVQDTFPSSIDGIVTAKALHDHLAEALGRASYGEERIVVTKNGKPVAAPISMRLLAVLEQLEDRLDVLAADEALADAEANGTVSFADVKGRLGL